MKKYTLIISILLLAVINSCASSGGKASEKGLSEESSDGKAPAIPEITLAEAISGAVTAMESALSNGTEIALADVEATPVKLAKHLEKELSDQIKKSGNLTVLARGAELERLIDELNFQMSGFVSDDSMISITSMLGAKSMVFGSFDDLGAFYQYRIRVIDTGTSAIQSTYSGRVIKTDQDINGLLGYGGKTSNRRVREEAIIYYNRGVDNMAAGVFIPAIEELSRAINIDPQFTAAYIRRGVAYTVRNENNKAKADFDSAVKLDPNNFLAYLNRGAVQSSRTSAIADYTKAIEIDHEYVPALIYRGDAYYYARDYDHAIADFTAALRLKPNDINFLYLRAQAYEAKKDYDRAIADFTSVIRLKPDDSTAYYLRGDMYFFDKKDYRNALTAYTEIINRFPNDANTYYIRGRTYEELKDFQRAIADWTQAIRLDPNFIVAYARRGLILLNRKDYDNAIADFTKAIGIKQDDIATYQKKIIPKIIENEDDQVSLIIVSGTILTDIDTSPEQLFYFRGVAYQNKGDVDKALADYSESLRINPNFNDALEHLFVFEEAGGKITITIYKGNEKDVRIPERINGLPVTAIGFNAFIGRQLTSVTIPNSVTTIGEQAFSGNWLTSVTIPNSVTTIRRFAFESNQLTSITIPNSVTDIGVSAFRGNRLTSVTLPDNVNIESSSFDGCYSFYSQYIINGKRRCTITISPPTTIGVYEIITVNNAGIEILKYNGNEKDVRIPERINGLPIITIGDEAFRAKQLTSVTIPNSVTAIGVSAFMNNQLTSLTIGANVILGLSAIDGLEYSYNYYGKRAATFTRPNTGTNTWSVQYR